MDAATDSHAVRRGFANDPEVGIGQRPDADPCDRRAAVSDAHRSRLAASPGRGVRQSRERGSAGRYASEATGLPEAPERQVRSAAENADPIRAEDFDHRVRAARKAPAQVAVKREVDEGDPIDTNGFDERVEKLRAARLRGEEDE